MSMFLTLAFLFAIGSVAGWVLEFFFRRFYSAGNPGRKWINPGFCTGPYLPIYGCGLCVLYLISIQETYSIIENALLNKVVLFAAMAVSMTIIELVAGLWCLKITTVRLCDYSNEWGNYEGVICPKFSLFWAILGAAYYFLIHPHILNALKWLSMNLAFSFGIGLFFGIFIIDAVHSAQLIAKLKKYANENQVIVRFEQIKEAIQVHHIKTKQKYHFFRPFRTERPLPSYLSDLRTSFEEVKHRSEDIAITSGTIKKQ